MDEPVEDEGQGVVEPYLLGVRQRCPFRPCNSLLLTDHVRGPRIEGLLDPKIHAIAHPTLLRRRLLQNPLELFPWRLHPIVIPKVCVYVEVVRVQRGC